MIQSSHFKSILSVLLIAAMAIFFSCSEKKPTPTEKKENQSDSPPSVKGENKSKILIKLTDLEAKELNIESLVVSSHEQKYTISAPGLVFPAANHIAIISTPIDGRISVVRATDGDNIKKGQELFRIESLEFGNMVSEYLQAVAEERFQSKRLERTEQLVKQTISSESELDRTRTDFQRASASVIASYAKLRAIGVSEEEITAMKNAEKIDPTLKIHSPVSGAMDSREVDLGQSVNALQKLARVVDLNQVQIKGYLSPEDAGFVNIGDTVTITRRLADIKPIVGQISSINPGLNETNRSVVVNILIGAQNGWPKPGENIRLEIKTSSQAEVIAIPVDALTYDGNNPVVFVKINPSTYEKRLITIRAIQNNYAIVDSGLEKSEEIAVSQVFSLKALSRFEQIAEE
jgi:membrane fusion protein, heavy metal efflux system